MPEWQSLKVLLLDKIDKSPPLKYENVYQLKHEFPELEVVINGGIKDVNDSLEHLNKVDGVSAGTKPL